MLKPVLQGFIDTFKNPESDSVKEIWKRICDWQGGSGMSYYSGWITAFCFWDTKGKRQIKNLGDEIDADKIPDGLTTVPVKIDDNGVDISAEMLAGSVGMACISSGKPSARWAYQEEEEEFGYEEGPVGTDTLQPQLGWFMYEKAE